MVRDKTIGSAGLAIAVAMAGCVGFAPMAEARHDRHHARVAKVPLIPAHQRPGYVGAPGYPGGPPGQVIPTLVDFSGGPLVGIGALGPRTGLFVGVPLLGQLGL